MNKNFIDISDGAVALYCILNGLKVERVWLKNHCCKWRVFLPNKEEQNDSNKERQS